MTLVLEECVFLSCTRALIIAHLMAFYGIPNSVQVFQLPGTLVSARVQNTCVVRRCCAISASRCDLGIP